MSEYFNSILALNMICNLGVTIKSQGEEGWLKEECVLEKL